MFRVIDNQIYDYMMRSFPAKVSTDQIAILDIDEDSLAIPELGRWPWSRNVLVELFQKLFEQYEVKVIGLDIVLAEPDTSSGLPILKELAGGLLQHNTEFVRSLTDLEPELDYDGRFEDFLLSHPVVLGYYFDFSKGKRSGSVPIPAVFGDEIESLAPFPEALGFGGNLERFTDAAPVSGHINPFVDHDGVIRRIPLLVGFEGDLYDALALAMARTALALDASDNGALLIPEVELQAAQIESVSSGEIYTPIDYEGGVYVPFAGPAGTFDYISVADVFHDRVRPERLKNKILLVGATAPGLLDLRATPVGAIFPGVEVHANLLAGLLSDDRAILQTPYWARLVALGSIAVITLASLIILSGLSPIVLIVALLIGSTALATAVWALWSSGLFIPVGVVLVAFIAALGLQLIFGFFDEYRRKKQFTDLFSQYVPPELVEKMAEDPERYSMAGQRKQISVLFSDVRGFTSISEQLPPTELSEFINLYLTTMTQIIRDEAGTLDKYIGDAIMAFWGAPLDAPDHADRSVRAALDMIKALEGLSVICAERGWPEISIGIGINTGDMNVGDMGSKIRKAYTVMGDAVNLGARLEGLTRQYGVWTIVSEFTVAACNGIIFRELDKVQVKGKEQPVTIFEPICLNGELSQTGIEELNAWNQALQNYRNQQFLAVINRLDQMDQTFGPKPIYAWLRQACEGYVENAPGEFWNGVTKFTSK